MGPNPTMKLHAAALVLEPAPRMMEMSPLPLQTRQPTGLRMVAMLSSPADFTGRSLAFVVVDWIGTSFLLSSSTSCCLLFLTSNGARTCLRRREMMGLRTCKSRSRAHTRAHRSACAARGKRKTGAANALTSRASHPLARACHCTRKCFTSVEDLHIFRVMTRRRRSDGRRTTSAVPPLTAGETAETAPECGSYHGRSPLHPCPPSTHDEVHLFPAGIYLQLGGELPLDAVTPAIPSE